jgi:hypothetical protein
VITGHFGLAAAVKSTERSVPLWALMLASVWLDVLFVPLLLMGIEHTDPVAGTGGGYGDTIIHADYTHSLVGALVISGLTGALCARWWGRRSGTVIGAVIFSHWILDLIVHRADMPILPADLGGLPRLGLGLWRYPLVTAIVEAGIMLAGTLLYWRAARRTGGPAGRVALTTILMAAVGALTLGLNLANI